MTYFSAIKAFDELAQGKIAIPQVAKAVAEYLVAEKTPEEDAVMKAGFKAWSDAINSMVEFNSTSDSKKAIILMMRSQFHEVAAMYADNPVALRIELVESEVL